MTQPSSTPRTVEHALIRATEHLTTHAIAEARLSAEYLLAHVVNLPRLELLFRRHETIADPQWQAFGALIERRAEHEPLEYILGRQAFCGEWFRVTPAVLIPRPETEQLIELIQGLLREPPQHILDVGTGSGCIAVTLARLYPEATVVASDLSRDALHVARSNARDHNAPVSFLAADTFRGIAPASSFELIVSNPPYIAEDELSSLAPEVRDREPKLALTCPGDGLAVLRTLAAEAGGLLKPGGLLALEIGAGQGPAVSELLNAASCWCEVRVHTDLAGRQRHVTARRTD